MSGASSVGVREGGMWWARSEPQARSPTTFLPPQGPLIPLVTLVPLHAAPVAHPLGFAPGHGAAPMAPARA